MSDLGEAFEERLREIEAYLDLLTELERAVQDGPPKLGGEAVTAQQQRMLYSSVYLHLYNLVESTATRCVEAVFEAIRNHGIQPKGLTQELRREWVKSVARTHIDLTDKKRLKAALYMCDFIVQMLPISDFKVSTGGGGNWDDKVIEKTAKRLGITMEVPPAASRGVKDRRWDDKGAMAHVRTLRNQLAHGNISFAECGQNITVSELRDIKERTATYLREIIGRFGAFIEAQEFVLPEYRGAGGTP